MIKSKHQTKPYVTTNQITDVFDCLEKIPIKTELFICHQSSRSCQVQERFEAPEFLQDPLNKAWLCWVRVDEYSTFPSNVILENPQSWSFSQAKMNRSFEVWFSPGAHSGAGAGDQKVRVGKSRGSKTEVLLYQDESESGCWQP